MAASSSAAARREHRRASSKEAPRAAFAVAGASESARFFGPDDADDATGKLLDDGGRGRGRGGGGGGGGEDAEGNFDYSGRSGSLNSGRMSDGNPLLDDSVDSSGMHGDRSGRGGRSAESREGHPRFQPKPTAVKHSDNNGHGGGNDDSGRSGGSDEHRTLLAAGQDTAQGGSRTSPAAPHIRAENPFDSKNGPVNSEMRNGPRTRAGPFGSEGSDDDDDDMGSEDHSGPLTPQDIEDWHSAQGGSRGEGSLGGSLPSLEEGPESSPDSLDVQDGSKRNVNFKVQPVKRSGSQEAAQHRDSRLTGSAFTTTTTSSDDTRQVANTAGSKAASSGGQQQTKPYYNLSRPEERKLFMEKMDGNSGGAAAAGEDEMDVERGRGGGGSTYHTSSPLFEAATDDDDGGLTIPTYKTRSSGTHSHSGGSAEGKHGGGGGGGGGAGLGGRDAFAGDDDGDDERYASMQELLDEDNRNGTTFERGRPRRRGRCGGCLASVLGEKGSRGRKWRWVALMGVAVLGVVAAGVYLGVYRTGGGGGKNGTEQDQLKATEGAESAPSPRPSAPERPLPPPVQGPLDGDGVGDLDLTWEFPTKAPSAPPVTDAPSGSPIASPTYEPTPLPTLDDMPDTNAPTTYAPTDATATPTLSPQDGIGMAGLPQDSTASPSPSGINTTNVTALGPCSICPDGIDAVGFDPAECQDAIEAYASYDEGSDVCAQGKVYQQICCPSASGSPDVNATGLNSTDSVAPSASDANATDVNATNVNATGPCSICPNGVDAAEADAVECQDAIEAYASYDAGSDVCEQGKEWQAICCPSAGGSDANATSPNSTDSGVNETGNNATGPCSICPNGLDAADADAVECQDALDAYASYDAESDVCEQGKEWQAICCPSEVEGPCSICPNGVDVVSILETGQYNETEAEEVVRECRETVEFAQTVGENSATCLEYEVYRSTCCPSEVESPLGTNETLDGNATATSCSICPNGVDTTSVLELGSYNETELEELVAGCQESIEYHAQFEADSFECANKETIESDCCPTTGVDNGTSVVIWGVNSTEVNASSFNQSLAANMTDIGAPSNETMNGTNFNSTGQNVTDGEIAVAITGTDLRIDSVECDANVTSLKEAVCNQLCVAAGIDIDECACTIGDMDLCGVNVGRRLREAKALRTVRRNLRTHQTGGSGQLLFDFVLEIVVHCNNTNGECDADKIATTADAVADTADDNLAAALRDNGSGTSDFIAGLRNTTTQEPDVTVAFAAATANETSVNLSTVVLEMSSPLGSNETFDGNATATSCSICPNGVDTTSVLELGSYNETKLEELVAGCQESIAYHAQFEADSFECANKDTIESDCCPTTGVDNGGPNATDDNSSGNETNVGPLGANEMMNGTESNMDGNVTANETATNSSDVDGETPATLPATEAPETTEASCSSIVDIAAGDENFSTLVAAVTAAGLVDALSGEGPLTVFAPTNDALAALPEGTVEALLEDPDALGEILKYHVVAANALSSSLESGDMETLSGDSVVVTVSDDGVMINDATVTVADIIACNGVIHAIDKVLLPPETLAGNWSDMNATSSNETLAGNWSDMNATSSNETLAANWTDANFTDFNTTMFEMNVNGTTDANTTIANVTNLNETIVANETIPIANSTETNANATIANTPPVGQSCPNTLDMTKAIDDSATLYYALVPANPAGSDNGLLCARLEVENDGWIGLGFSNNNKMGGSQAVIGVPANGTVLKYSLFSYGVVAMADENQTLQDASLTQEDGKTIMTFTKLLTEDGEIPILDTDVNIFLHARGGDELAHHSYRTIFEMSLENSGNTTQSSTASPTPGNTTQSSTTLPTPGNITKSSTTSTTPGFGGSTMQSSTTSPTSDFDGNATQSSTTLPTSGFDGNTTSNSPTQSPTAPPTPSPTAGPTKNDTMEFGMNWVAASGTAVDVLNALSDPYTMTFSQRGPSGRSRYGSAMAISGDAKLIVVGAKDAVNGEGTAMGAVYIYSLDTAIGSEGLPLLQTLTGENEDDEYGNAVALSKNGERLVVGSRNENDRLGGMRIYERNDSAGSDSTWELMQAGVVPGEFPGGRSGWSVSISADSNVIAMGSPTGGSDGGGSVVTFKYDDATSDWGPYGSVLEGLDDAAGYSISLSDDGSAMVVGFPKATNPLSGASNAGKTQVFRMGDTTWEPVGQEIYGESQADLDGTSVAMSHDGSIVVIGGMGTDRGDVNSAGYCRIYRFQDTEWVFEHSLWGETADERLGTSVAVSPDGNVVGCGGVNGEYGDGDNAARSGVVRLWNRARLEESVLWPRGSDEYIEDATFGYSLAFSDDGEYVIVGAPQWSGSGKGRYLTGAIQAFRDETEGR